ncbi:hypothetical protein MNBD_GAMMA17-2227 [hydrothermal vent metagenome]|uniref:Uncharacterized protein n=1 Tax=hydrothermal vent metagenome TaxID=652676 RepID=A0A3B0YUC4_9ZZZZ
MSHYAPLFTFIVEHGFYDSGLAHGLSFKPCERSASVMLNAGLMVKPVVGGIAVLFDEKLSESLQLYIEDDEPLDLLFKIYPEEASFKSRTRVAIDNDDEMVLYVSNHLFRAEVDGRIKLHSGSFISMDDAIRMDSDSLVDVLDRKEKVIPPFLVVSFRIDKADLEGIGAPSGVAPKSYYIRVEERQVFWKYYLMGSLVRDNIYLSDVDGVAEFVPMGKEQLADHREAMIFRSKKKLPLKASFDYRFQLKEKDSNGEKVIIKRLPMAEVTRFGREVIDGSSEVVSEIYINC